MMCLPNDSKPFKKKIPRGKKQARKPDLLTPRSEFTFHRKTKIVNIYQGLSMY